MRTATFTFVETHERTVLLLMVLRPFSHRSLCLDSLCPPSVCEAPRVQKRNSNAKNETGFVHRRDECKNHRITRIYNTIRYMFSVSSDAARDTIIHFFGIVLIDTLIYIVTSMCHLCHLFVCVPPCYLYHYIIEIIC